MPGPSQHATGADAAIEALKRNGVDTVFGITSIHMLDVYDALLRDGSIRLVVPRHEQAVVHMADGYARAAGRPGVALTSTGPGAANGMGAMLEALDASSPVVHITSQIATPLISKGKGALHETKSQERMFQSVADHVALVERPDDVGNAIHHAFNHVRTPGAGPAVVVLPVDVQSDRVERIEPGVTVDPAQCHTVEADDYDRAAEALRQARFPVIVVGGGVVSAVNVEETRAQLISLVEALSAPVLTTPESRGAFPEDHPLALGSLMAEWETAPLLKRADAMLALGTRFRGPVTGEWRSPVPEQLIHVDINPAIIGRNYPCTQAIVADAASAITALHSRLSGLSAVRDDVVQLVHETRDAVRATAEKRYRPYVQLADAVQRSWPDDGIVVADATMITYFGFHKTSIFTRPRSYIFPGTYAMGPSLPLAAGAALAAPDRPVLQIAGDSGYMLNVAELTTLAQYDIPVVSVVINDAGYGVIRLLQTQRYRRRFVGVDHQSPDFVALAAACGVAGERVTSVNNLEAALARACATGKPRLIEVDFPAIAATAVDAC